MIAEIIPSSENFSGITVDEETIIFRNTIPEDLLKYGKRIIFLQTEPRAMQPNPHTFTKLLTFYKYFHMLLVHDEELLKLPNATFIQPYADYYWVQPPLELNNDNHFFKENNIQIRKTDYSQKEFKITMLCGGKNYAQGHKLRINCWHKQKDITIPKEFYISKEPGDIQRYADNRNTSHKHDKTELVEKAMFHVAIENSSIKNYFSEKLNDCIASKTVAIYWGCTNIEEFYNKDAFIIIKDENDFINVVNSLTPEIYYQKQKALDENYHIFHSLKSVTATIEEKLRK